MNDRALDIVFATAEAVPFAKTGGLADVCSALPRELARQGARVRLFLPAYRSALRSGLPIEPTGIEWDVPIGQQHVHGRLLRSRLPGTDVPVYLVDRPAYYDRPALYGESGRDYSDNCERFVFFCRAVLQSLIQMEAPPDILHAHDWQTGLIPVYLKTLYAHEPAFATTSTVFSLHNLAYQGRFWHWDMLLTGLDWKWFNWRELEFHGDLNLLKGGIVFADWLTTVSPTYAREIQTPEYGCGLEGAIAERRERLTGILNGIDTEVWNPQTDPFLPARYGIEDAPEGKRLCKKALLEEMEMDADLDRPLVGLIGRLARQKGWDVVVPVMEKRDDVLWVVLGSGDPQLENRLLQLAATRSRNVAVHIGFDEGLAHRIEAGADLFVMASRYEPCGLNQLYSQRYGTIPVVHATGGLVDTVVHASEEAVQQKRATGFHFKPLTCEALDEAISAAIRCYREAPGVWRQLMRTAMEKDMSWTRSAREYRELYRRLVQSRRAPAVSSGASGFSK